MTGKFGTGLLIAGACSACWIAPLLVALLGAGWAGEVGASWAWIAGAGVIAGAAAVVVRRAQRRRRAGCSCPPAPAP